MSRIRKKHRILKLLATNDLHSVYSGLREFDYHEAVNILFSGLCHSQELVRWHAVSCYGMIVPAIARKDLEEARIIMRRFLWMLNDESGGIGWGVPEAMGEVMHAETRLADEYLHMLVSYTHDDGPELHQDGNFIELPGLQRGVLWGLWRASQNHGEKLLSLGVADNLKVYFPSPDSLVRALACKLAGKLLLDEFQPQITKLRDDQSRVSLYMEGAFEDLSVKDCADQALKSLKTPD